jgi:tetratricopeptide (TPR) repeat protein
LTSVSLVSGAHSITKKRDRTSMSDPPRSPSHPTSFTPHASSTQSPAVFLQTEQESAAEPQHKALLLHELGVLEERGGEEMEAAREFLAAFNAHAQFREPLEGLVRLLERRKSVKNLPKLLDALLRVAESPVEKARALVKRAAFLADFKKDDGGARASLLQATTEREADPTPWLELEVLAGRTNDPALRVEALEARAKLETNATWRGLLLVALADLLAKQGETEQATKWLETALALDGGARFRAAGALERLARDNGQKAAYATALEAQADLVVAALTDPAEGDRLGVPRSARQQEVVADAWLRAAETRKQLGDLVAAATLLDKALERVGPRAAILTARLSVAETAGDTATAERIAETLLDQGIKGPSAAALLMRVAEAAANRDDAAGALAALTKALEADAGCIPARALQIDLLGNATDASALASALEAMAAELPSDEAKGRAFLLSAYVFAIQARDVSGAKAALSQAGMYGLSPGLLARTGRMLAAVLEDSAWYDEATKRLVSAGGQAADPLSLWFELGRSRVLRGEDESAARAFESIAGAPGGEWLGPALGAYTLGRRGAKPADGAHGAEGGAKTEAPAKKVGPPEMLDRLRKAEPDAQAMRALAVAAARRADLGGDLDQACARLHELFEAEPGDLPCAVYLADLEKRAKRPLESAKVLAAAAATITDPELAALLHLEAAVLLFRSGERRIALDELEAALAQSEKPVAPLFAWALRAIDAASTEERRRLLDRALELSEDGPLLSLQRLTLELFSPTSDAETIKALLDGVERRADGDLAAAAALVRVLWDEKGADRDAFVRAVELVAASSDRAAPLAAWESLRLARLESDHILAGQHARTFAESMRSLPANLEWLGAAMAAGDRTGEITARRTIAEAFSGEARSAMLASAALVSLIDAPDGVEPLLQETDAGARIMNLELAPPGTGPRRRAAALFGLENALGDEARFDALVMAGYNHLALGNAEEALSCFDTVTTERPDDLFAWEGLRSAAETLGNVEKQAIACAELGELSADDKRSAEFFEHAALLSIDELGDETEGERILERAFAKDPARPVAFDRLFRRVRERGDADKLLALIARRLDVAEDPDELAKLYWERARVLRQKGDRSGALAALENVTMIEPDHVGALALKGEIDITQSNFEGAAKNLSRLATLEEAPAQQRLMSGVAAVDLYENKLNDTRRALEILVSLHESGLSTMPVRERLARAAAKVGSWGHATSILQQLMTERATSDGRIEAARLAMAIWRDKLRDPTKAEAPIAKLLEESPEDGEALDLLLETKFPATLKRHLLLRGRFAIVEALSREPADLERIVRLSSVAKALSDLPLRQATLGVLKALTGSDPAVEQELELLDERVARVPQVAVDDKTIGMIGDPDDHGPLTNLFAAIADALSEALGPSLEGLGVSKKHRVDPRSGLPIRNEVAAWAGALGLGEFDLYVGGNDPGAVHGIASEIPAIVVGSAVTAPLTPDGRQAIARELFALRRGISVTRTRDDTTVAAIVVAACNLAEVRIDSPPYAMLNDVQRLLGKTISRRTRKILPDLCRAIVAEHRDVRAWARSALASMYRMAAIAAGDVSLVLSDALGAPVSRLPDLIGHDERARRLIAFVLSPRYLELRGKLGMGVT